MGPVTRRTDSRLMPFPRFLSVAAMGAATFLGAARLDAGTCAPKAPQNACGECKLESDCGGGKATHHCFAHPQRDCKTPAPTVVVSISEADLASAVKRIAEGPVDENRISSAAIHAQGLLHVLGLGSQPLVKIIAHDLEATVTRANLDGDAEQEAVVFVRGDNGFGDWHPDDGNCGVAKNFVVVLDPTGAGNLRVIGSRELESTAAGFCGGIAVEVAPIHDAKVSDILIKKQSSEGVQLVEAWTAARSKFERVLLFEDKPNSFRSLEYGAPGDPIKVMGVKDGAAVLVKTLRFDSAAFRYR